jgi:hypothetical protein
VTDRLALRPAEGRRVRLPGQAEAMPPEGMEVDVDIFVRRRIDDGDLVAAADAAPVTEEAGKPRNDRKGKA